jgi:hypothetical protein
MNSLIFAISLAGFLLAIDLFTSPRNPQIEG